MRNQSAEDWIWQPIEVIVNSVYSNESSNFTDWPWMFVSSEEFRMPLSQLLRISEAERFSKLVPLLIGPFGAIGSLCSILAFWRRGFHKRESFYVWMIFIALFDFLFSICALPVFAGYWTQYSGGNVYRYSYHMMQTMQILYGVLFSFSLNSDLCTIGLTMERFLGICRPVETRGLPLWRKKAIVYGGASIAIVCNAARFIRYAFQNTAIENPGAPGTYSYADTWFGTTVFFTALSQFTDLLLPFLLLIPMVYFSVRIAIAMIQRRRGKVSDLGDAEKHREFQERTWSMLKLLAVLVLLFVLSQIGYCLYAIAFAYVTTKKITYEASYEEILVYMDGNLFFAVSMIVCNTAECASRSLNFYLYFCFSTSTRKHFFRALGLGGPSGRIKR